MSEMAMKAAQILHKPTALKYKAEGRLWQGIASMERTKAGRTYIVFYSGLHTEEAGNFVVLSRGFENEPKENWEDALYVIEHENPEIRCFDPCLWIDPKGRLWCTWTQSFHNYDGRDGVWAIVCDDPDADDPVFSAPRRIANGLMMNKPIVCKNGDWLFPCALWTLDFFDPAEEHPECAREIGSNVYVTRDEGKTFTYLGGANVPDRAFDEHMVVELKDGRLWMLVRTQLGIGESYSFDGGITWTPGWDTGISGPNSRFFVRRLKSGRILLVNHMNFRYGTRGKQGFTTRNNLVAQLSEDEGLSWKGCLVLDTRDEISYPDGKQDENGVIHIVYDRERYKAREVLLAAFTEKDILEGGIVTEGSYLRKVVSMAMGEE